MGRSNLIITGIYDSPCGKLLLGEFNGSLCLCDWQQGKPGTGIMQRLQIRLNASFRQGDSPLLNCAKKQLDEYFDGLRQNFDIPLLFAGSDFQTKVWRSLLSVAYGTTVSYAELSQRIGMPDAIRAVANANGANALSVFVPCHRVIGSNGTLTGYGGGIETKAFLLKLEGCMP